MLLSKQVLRTRLKLQGRREAHNYYTGGRAHSLTMARRLFISVFISHWLVSCSINTYLLHRKSSSFIVKAKCSNLRLLIFVVRVNYTNCSNQITRFNGIVYSFFKVGCKSAICQTKGLCSPHNLRYVLCKVDKYLVAKVNVLS